VWLRWLPGSDSAISPEDIAAQAWLTAASKIHGFQGSDDDFAGWLFGIARRHAINNHRRGLRRRTAPADPHQFVHAEGPNAQDDVGRVDEHDATRRLLARLSPREAEVIACIDVAGLGVRSTAAALQITPTAVRVARHRGLNRLRKLLSPQGSPGLRGSLAIDDRRG
jgi:RNA polymerase sigma-70 factor, ECF subfamily